MQEKLKKLVQDKAEPEHKTVRLFIGLRQTDLGGTWCWNLHSDAVYCSDVMSFPTDFEGTKGIIHPDDLEKVSAALSLLPDMSIDQLDFRIITTYGEVKLLEGRQVTIDESADEPKPEKQVWEDQLTQIAARRETALLKQRSPLADMSERLHGTATWWINKSTGAAWYSDGVFRLHGLPPQSLNAHPNTFASFIHPDDHATVMDAFDRAYACESPLHIEYRIIQPGGIVQPLRLSTHWTFNEEGQAILRGVLRNLAELQELQQLQQQAEANQWLHQQVLGQAEESAAFGYWFMNLVTRKTYFSPNYIRLHGVKAGVVPNHKTFLDVVHPEDKPLVQALIEKAQNEHVLPETTYRIIRPNGKTRFLQLSGKLTIHEGKELVMVGIVIDVSPHHSLSKSLGEAQARNQSQQYTLELASEAAGVSSVAWLQDGQMLWSDGFYRIMGYRPHSVEPQFRVWQKSVYTDDLKFFTQTVTLALNGQPVESAVIRIVSKSGLRRLKLTFRQPPDPSPEILIALVQDVTEQVALQQQLALREHFIGNLEDSDKDLLLYTNVENTIINWNAGAAEKTGLKKEEVLHKNLFEVLPDLREEAYLSILNTALLGKESSLSKASKGYFFRAHSITLKPITDENGTVLGVLHRVQDLSREMDLQQRLAERLYFIESLINATIDRIVVLDQHLNYLYWNPKAEAYYAISKQQVLGRNLLEIFPGFRNDPSYRKFQRALRGETVHIPAKVEENNSEYAETYFIPVKNEDGAVTAVLWIVHDLTREWQFQQELQKHIDLLQEEQRRLLEAQGIGHIGSYEWNMGAAYVNWSDEMYCINGLVPGSQPISAESTDAMVHPDDLEQVMQLKKQAFKSPGFYNLVHRIVNPDGRIKYVRHRFESIAGEDGTIVRVHGTLQDITQQMEDQQNAGSE